MRHPMLKAAVAMMAMAGVARAHPRLLSTFPVADTIVASPARIRLHFSERLITRFSSVDLMMAGSKGGVPVKVASTAVVALGGHTVVVTPTAALRPGRYDIDWRVVSADTHHVAGTYSFVVR